MFTLVVTVDLPCYASIPSNSIESTQPICNVVLGSVVRMVTESELLRTQTCNHKSHKGFLCNKRQTRNVPCTQVDVLEGEILVTSVLWGWTASLSPAGWRNCNLGTCVLQSQPPCSTNVASYVTLHYAARAMGAMTLRISELCLSFSPHPNISDGNVNLVHHFFCIQIFQINGKGPS